MNEEHLLKIKEMASDGKILLIDAVQEYVETNGLDPYFIADLIQSDKEFLTEVKKDATKLNLLK
ncbi:MAG: hypothetical protein NTZ20_04715 [Candidatus Levybacteria bacterium]|nr:hypothetical protein [Candidatus Levybacteria bacterium]